MRRQLRLTFQTGECVVAELLDDEAPATAAHVWDRLPIEAPLVHGQFSGAEVFVLVDDPARLPAENLVQLPLPGELLYFYEGTESATAGRGPVEAFDFGDVLPGEVIAFEVDAICPDETALFIPTHRALACADGVVRWPGSDELRFVPDELMDDPERTKAGLRDAYRRLLDLDFELVLLAHGNPVVTSGKEALRSFANAA